MGVRLIKKAAGDKIREAKNFMKRANAGNAVVSLAYTPGLHGKLVGVFANHEAAAKHCARLNVTQYEIESEPVGF